MKTINQELFNTILKQLSENEDTFNDVSAVQFSYGSYNISFYTYDLVNFTPSVDNFGRIAKNNEWVQYEPTKEQIELMRSKLEENYNAYIKREVEENNWTESDREHVAYLWNHR